MRASVLVNNYNNGDYLRACLDSVLAAEDPLGCEIVVYDDGSTDGSDAILRSYGGRITVIHGARHPDQPVHVNQGLAIERAFARATGELIFLLDGDDLFLPHKIARYRAAFAGPEQPVMVQSTMRLIDEAGRPITHPPEPFRHERNLLRAVQASHDPDVFYPTSALAFRRSLFERWLPLDWRDDGETWFDCRLACAALVSGPVVTLAEECACWRWHPRSHFTSQATDRLFLIRQTWRRVRQFNECSAKASQPGISIWLNRRFYRQLFGLLLPTGRRWRRRTHSPAVPPQ